MLIYKTDRPNSFYSFKQLFTTVVVVLLPVFYDQLFPTGLIKDTYNWVAGTLILMRIIDEIGKDRLVEIHFDTDKMHVIFIYKTFFILTRQKTLKFDTLLIEIVQSKSNWTWFFEPLSLYFLKDKKEVFQINKSKDGFSVEKLKEITKTIEALSLRMKKF